MGCFSWFTQDKSHTRIVIGDVKQPIYMIGEVNGRIFTYTEENYYDGYGNFGGMDYYIFMARMNGKKLEDFKGENKKEQLRMAGIEMAFDGDPYGYSKKWKHPTLTLIEGDYHNGEAPESDPDQGFQIY